MAETRADKLKTPMKKRPVPTDSDSDEDEDGGMMFLKEVLKLNRAAHVLTKSGSTLDKLLKKGKEDSCEFLIREYDLSSVLVLTKRETGEGSAERTGTKHEEGFKKLSTVKKENKKMNELSISKPTTSAVDPESDDHKDEHHSPSDPLDIVLYCRNKERVPRVGRVVRMVESEAQKGTKYIIELVK